MFWNENNNLQFMVHRKKDQKLKYLNKGSSHPNSCFCAIPYGVFLRLCKLTSQTKANLGRRIDELYPDHALALCKARLIQGEFPTMRDFWDEVEKKRKNSDKEVEFNENNFSECQELNDNSPTKNENEPRKKNNRQTYFCIGFSDIWRRVPIHATLKKLRDKFNLKWLRISMSYHKFPNMRELFQSDLTTKLTEDLKSMDFMDLPCNCSKRTTINVKCVYGGRCRHSLVVYKVTCKATGKFYIGNTQQKLKKRIDAHLGETCDLVNKSKASDSFARHFAEQFTTEAKITRNDVREKIYVEILWKGRAVPCIKSFRKLTCNICMKERLQILTHLRKYPKLTINSNYELYGACRHKTKFHRYENSIFISADESHQGSKRIDETSNGNLTSQCIKCTSSISTYSESENSGRESELSPSTGSSLDTPGSTSSRDTYNNFMKFDF